jgi:hypothetical protein
LPACLLLPDTLMLPSPPIPTPCRPSPCSRVDHSAPADWPLPVRGFLRNSVLRSWQRYFRFSVVFDEQIALRGKKYVVAGVRAGGGAVTAARGLRRQEMHLPPSPVTANGSPPHPACRVPSRRVSPRPAGCHQPG